MKPDPMPEELEKPGDTDSEVMPIKRPAKPDDSFNQGHHNGDHRRVGTRGFHKVK